MGSGKSSFCKALLKKTSNYTYICLDDFRKRKFEDVLTESHNPLEFEKEVAIATQNEIAKHNKIIYETTGATRFFKDIHYKLTAEQHRIFLIEIFCPEDICIERHYNREKQGHFHVVPQYGKGLSPEELIKRYSEKTKWIKPDLVLDSNTYNVDKLVDQFFRKYFPTGPIESLKEILDDFNYNEALDWFKSNVKGKQFIKEMLSSGEDSFNRLKLKKALNEHLSEIENEPEIQDDPKLEELEKTNEATTQLHSKIDPSSPLREEWSPLFKEANFLFIELEHEQDPDKLEQMVFKITSLMDQVQEFWDKSDFIKEYGHAPNFNSAGIENISESQKTKRINTLRTYISKAKKGKLKAEKIPEWEAEKLELERNLS